MTSALPPFDNAHPLLEERERLDQIIQLMLARINKTLHDVETTVATEQILNGTAISAEDILAESLEGLLRYSAGDLQGTWEGLAVRIARNKAVDAIRTAQKGLGGTTHRKPLRLVSGDTINVQNGDETKSSLFDMLESKEGDPAENLENLNLALRLKELAWDLLDPIARDTFFLIHFRGDTRKEVAETLNLTSQRISQIYIKACKLLFHHLEDELDSGEARQGGTDEH